MTSARTYIFVRSKSNLRGHLLKLHKKGARLDIAKYSFCNRVVNEWNNLSDEVNYVQHT